MLAGDTSVNFAHWLFIDCFPLQGKQSWLANSERIKPDVRFGFYDVPLATAGFSGIL